MDALVSHVPGVGKRFNAYATPTRKQTTAPDVRPMDEYSRIAACHAFLERTGRGHWRNWRLSPGRPGRRSSQKSSVDFKDANSANDSSLQQQLLLCSGKVGQLAKRVGMERTHLYRKLRALGVDFRQLGDD
jgi:transcriptional regulator of acetoin/glycerol metabolism